MTVAPDEIGPDPVDLLQGDSLSRHLTILARLLEHALRRRFVVHGVVPGQFAQLLALYAEEPLTQRELCRRVCVEQSTMARTLARMERDGLVTYAIDPHDARRRHVVLTPRARELRDQLLTIAREVNDAAARGIGPREGRAFSETVARLITNLRDGPDGPPAEPRDSQEER